MSDLLAEASGTQRLHRKELKHLFETTKGPMSIASAYVTDTDLLGAVKDREVRLLTSMARMDFISGASSLDALTRLVKKGVKCRCVSDGPKLHAKVYIFGDQTAVVTSANLTRYGLDSNIEVGVRLGGGATHELTQWFDALWGTADVLDLPTLFEWQQDTAALRIEYSALRKKAMSKPTLPNEVHPAVASVKGLSDLFDNANRFFVCNTNRKYSDVAERNMRQRNHATAWEEFKFPAHMEKVKQGNAIFMFAKGVGIIGIGRAKAPPEVLEPDDPDRVGDSDEREWRVPVDWLAWIEDDADAFSWESPNFTFFDVSSEKYSDLRDGVRKHFLGHP